MCECVSITGYHHHSQPTIIQSTTLYILGESRICTDFDISKFLIGVPLLLGKHEYLFAQISNSLEMYLDIYIKIFAKEVLL